MGSVGGEDSSSWDDPGSSAKEERILVSVRFRPLNDRERSKDDAWEWECVNDTTILPKNIPNERSVFPTSYTFDRVFNSDCSTKQVYEDGAKKVALSVVSGINASILAYGQTSSGKTYTMSGITEYTMLDIFDYVNKHEDREFELKFAAMEIYNESVRDLLSSDHTPLRVLDDPERGIVVDKLKDVTLKDWGQVIDLLAICNAQRKIAETSLNEMSSRSHQILRLTVVNSARSSIGSDDSGTLAATVNFVDLAGSERASQTMSAGAQLKEGGHINSSLLTLGTVIRRLSKGNYAHIPYRDSKLTRILQNSLGGNARTAIICTLSPAHRHAEQSRNTLLFASCAKKVSGSVKANIVTSDKALVKKLERDLARMKAELKALGSLCSHSESNWKERDLLIEQMNNEIRELIEQRDEAQTHLQLLLQSGGDRSSVSGSLSSLDRGSCLDDYSSSETSEVVDNLRSNMTYNKSQSLERYGWYLNKNDEQWDDQLISDETPTVFIDKYFGPDPTHGWENVISISTDPNIEDDVKEVQCYEVEDNGKSCENDEQLSFQLNESPDSSPSEAVDNVKSSKVKAECDHMILDQPIYFSPPCSSDSEVTIARQVSISRCTSFQGTITTPVWPPPIPKKANKSENAPLSNLEKETQERLNDDRVQEEDNTMTMHSTHASEESIGYSGWGGSTSSEDESDHKSNVSPCSYDTTKCQNESTDSAVPEVEPTSTKSEDPQDGGSKTVEDSQQSTARQRTLQWLVDFEDRRRDIIILWDTCYVPLVHRTYFFLLFKGEPSDAVYMEVEHRRLSFLQSTLNHSSVKEASRALYHEREKLSRLISKKFSIKERTEMYERWRIKVKSKKRRFQLCCLLWKDSNDIEQVKESAALIAKLIGLAEQSAAPEQIFGLSIPQLSQFKTHSRRRSLPSFRLV